MRKINILVLLFLCLASLSSAQQKEDKIRWSATRKLTLEDFAIKTAQRETNLSSAQFFMSYKTSGFDFMTKNFNKRVEIFLIKSASWIDTAANIRQSLTYQQTIFDIGEIYTRLFRKALRDNRKKLISGSSYAESLNQQYMTDFSVRRMEYERATKYGSDSVQQKKWEIQVQEELLELKDFAYEH